MTSQIQSLLTSIFYLLKDICRSLYRSSGSTLSFVQFEASSYYQLVLLDIRMPRLNGLQLFNTIKAISPATKIMFVSALDIAEELTSMLPDIKYEDIIKKPVEREYFISKINSVLNHRLLHFGSLGA
jgi:DNA-binding response OmpR family regulator